LKEIVTHALERVRGGNPTMPIPWVEDIALFLSSMCSFEAQEQQHDQQDNICCVRILALDLLQEGVIRLYKTQQIDNDSINNVLAATLRAVDWFHRRTTVSNQHLEGLFKASWVSLDAIAVGSKLPPVFTFNCCLIESNMHHVRPALSLLHSTQSMKDAAMEDGLGMFHFFLDVILFRPDLSNSVDYNFEQWRRQRLALAQRALRTHLQQPGTHNMDWLVNPHDQLNAQSSERGVSAHDLSYRLHYRANSDKIIASEEIRKETRNIKFSCLRYATSLFSSVGNVTCMKRAVLLTVIARSDANEVISKEGEAQFQSLMRSMHTSWHLWSTKSDNWVSSEYITSLACSLLILVLGKERLIEITEGMGSDVHCEMEWEDILGPVTLIQEHTLPRATVSSVVDFIRKQVFVSDWWQRLQGNDEMEEIEKTLLIELSFEVAKDAVGMADINDSNEEEPFVVIQRLQQYFHHEEARLCALGAGLFHDLSDKLLGNPSYNNRFHEYFHFAVRVIDLTATIFATVLPSTNDSIHPTIVAHRLPDFFGDHVDGIGHLLDHRRMSAQAIFRGECYQVAGAYMCRHDSFVPETKEMNFFKIPQNLLQCMMAEDDETLKEVIAISLHNVLQSYERDFETQSSQAGADLSLRLASFFPILLSASCSYNALVRLSVVKCATGILKFLDQPAAHHFLSFLLKDVDSEVAKASACGLAQLKCTDKQATAVSRPGEQNYDTYEFFDCSSEEHVRFLLSQLQQEAHVISCDVCPSRQNAMKFLRPLDTLMDSVSDERCNICYESILSPNDFYALRCDHKFCRSCWVSYVHSKIEGGPDDVLHASCPSEKCTELLTEVDILNLTPSLIHAWRKCQVDAYIQRTSNYRCCPGLDCPIIIKAHASCKRARCTACRTEVCFLCGRVPHSPATCKDVVRWDALYNAESSPKWMLEHTRPCPGCHVRIEKNQGCNHVHCTKCDCHFCWICCNRIDPRCSHVCSKYDPSRDESSGGKDFFYMGRYQAHDNAEIFALDQLSKMNDIAHVWMRSPLYLEEEEITLIEQATSALITCRQFLKYSLVRMYFTRDEEIKEEDTGTPTEQGGEDAIIDIGEPRCNTAISCTSQFEAHQSVLELLTEKLNALTETNMEQERIRYGACCIPLHLRSLSFYTKSVLGYIDRMETFIRNGMLPAETVP